MTNNSAGRSPSTCPICHQRYIQTNWMIRRGWVYGENGGPLNTHILGCARRAGVAIKEKYVNGVLEQHIDLREHERPRKGNDDVPHRYLHPLARERG